MSSENYRASEGVNLPGWEEMMEMKEEVRSE